MSATPDCIPVHDPFGAAADAALPTVPAALDPAAAAEEFKRGLPRLAGEGGRVEVKSITVIRHKAGKRCVIEYDVRVERPGQKRLKAKLIGKIRARRYGTEGYRLQDAFWSAGLRRPSPDHIAVPEPVGVITPFRMWLQRRVNGVTATGLIGGPDGPALAARIADGIHKVHCAGVPTEKAHAMADELRILHECLPRAAALRPELGARIDRMLAGCDRLGAGVPAPKACGIHRDFYPAQVVVDAERLWLLDFDLYCLGDPGLDIGNFIGHVTEESLRTHGDPAAWSAAERAMEERFVQLAGESVRPAIHAYTTLTLARHVYLSTQFPERQPFTDRLLALCEHRLADAGRLA